MEFGDSRRRSSLWAKTGLRKSASKTSKSRRAKNAIRPIITSAQSPFHAMTRHTAPLPWLSEHDRFPAVSRAWTAADPAPGLLAAGGTLTVPTLVAAYSQGIFPWFSAGQPILWWSPDPRMTLQTHNFKLSRSLAKTLARFRVDPACQIRMDHAFQNVIESCAGKPRAGQNGTWIVPEMVQAYTALHQAGHAHSVETWVGGKLVGGLYCVNLGGMVYGESMFSHQTDASKIALAALVAFCLAHQIKLIDCQQNTQHLASLGASEMDRTQFLEQIQSNMKQPRPRWQFESAFWDAISNLRGSLRQ